MTPEYIKYASIDFLKDEDFIRWQLFHNEEDVKYWQEQMYTNPQIVSVLGEAIARFKAIRLNDYHLKNQDVTALFQKINNRIEKEIRHRKVRWEYRIAVAASVAVICVISSLYYFGRVPAKDSLLAGANIVHEVKIPADQVTLLLDDSVVVLGDNAHVEYAVDGSARVNNGKKSLTKEGIPHMNKLIVPCGKRSSLALADGSKIWVNSGTTVEFPSLFNSDKREIKVDGEIYIEVEKDASRPFYVKTSNFDVRVLGTKFNISAYNDDIKQAVVLVEGSVEVTTRQKDMIKLKPNQLLSMASNVNITRTVDVEDYICWKNGWLQYHSATLSELSVQLSRYYNREIHCDPSVRDLRCTGKLILFEDIEQVMSVISANMNIVCHYNENQITLVPNPKHKTPM